ncbi:hypothetical protein [Nocardia bovistercoris]|uniref:Uncharacterized protein n=1 Tax=Nocardia bovistercoris TaxID=2785916 RepID=A0A931IFG2_9NOCA|nr:hypothetical protein [Nocardia bovistercoris]MBH0778810.1 hypothetical protein [Nocardia bovistercoris]
MNEIQTQTPIVVLMRTDPECDAHGNYGHSFSSTVELRGKFRHQRSQCNFTVHYLDETTESRREYQGPIIKGEYAFLVPQATVISSHPIARRTVIEVENGDLISIVGRTFRISDDVPLDNPRLIRVQG